MKIIKYTQKNYQEALKPLLNRTAFNPEIEKNVAKILKDIQQNGNKAIIKYAKKYDKATLTPKDFLVNEEEIKAAGKTVSKETKLAIKTAYKQIQDFCKQRIPKPWSHSPRPGVIMGERFSPLSRVGCYIPGGTAPLISTVLHTVAMANTAGVKEIVVITPPSQDGTIHPAILYAAKIAGATQIYRLGGVYAIAALAYGTETIKKVEKIVGPGNAYVTAAKRQVYGYVALDLVAGPSEIMIIADETANPKFIAADMLSQAEHGSGHEQAILATTEIKLIQEVKKELLKQSKSLKRKEIVDKVLQNGIFLILVETLPHATALASEYAPEHLEIMTKRAGVFAKQVTAAGAIFLGSWTPEPVGDFVAGPSHVLPTGGAAKYFSGLTIEQFFRRMSVINYQKNALIKELPHIQQFAQEEGLDAHGKSASIRNEN